MYACAQIQYLCVLKLCANFNEQSLPMFWTIAVVFFRVSNARYQIIGYQIKVCQNLTHCLLLSRDTVCRALTVYCRVCHSPHAHDYVCGIARVWQLYLLPVFDTIGKRCDGQTKVVSQL